MTTAEAVVRYGGAAGPGPGCVSCAKGGGVCATAASPETGRGVTVGGFADGGRRSCKVGGVAGERSEGFLLLGLGSASRGLRIGISSRRSSSSESLELFMKGFSF